MNLLVPIARKAKFSAKRSPSMTRKISTPSPEHRRAKPSYSDRARAIELRRANAMDEIRSLHDDGAAPGSFSDKAKTLLTNGWSRSSWKAREDILRTVDWLLRLEHRRRNGSGAESVLPFELRATTES